MNAPLRRFALGAAVTSLAGAITLLACEFPSPSLADVDTSVDAGKTVEDSGEPPNDAGMETPFDPDAEVTEDAGKKVDTSGCAVDDCDCDDDGYFDLTKLGCAAKADGGPGDCDDSDTRFRPDQEYVKIQNPPNAGDWNCDGTVENYYKNTNVVCAGVLDANCAKKQGFTGKPGCGEAGDYVHCGAGGLLNLDCVAVQTETLIQSCK